VAKFLLHTLWRLLVLALGVALVYGVFVVVPYLDRRLPFFVALLVAYIGVAYFALPAIVRFWRVIVKPDHIPLYATTADGWPSDPVNIAIVAKSKRHFIKCMKKSGWYTADKATIRNSIREAWAILLDKPYPNAPFSNLYLFNRTFDIGFQIPYGTNKSPRHRHHVRFWQLIDRKQDHGHFSFWVRHFRRFRGKNKTIWIGTAIDDVGTYGIRWYNLQITHSTHPLHHQERDFLIKTLEEKGSVAKASEIKAGEPFEIHSQQIGMSFISDGKLKIIELL
jgi:hypothetical protein